MSGTIPKFTTKEAYDFYKSQSKNGSTVMFNKFTVGVSHGYDMNMKPMGKSLMVYYSDYGHPFYAKVDENDKPDLEWEWPKALLHFKHDKRQSVEYTTMKGFQGKAVEGIIHADGSATYSLDDLAAALNCNTCKSIGYAQSKVDPNKCANCE